MLNKVISPNLFESRIVVAYVDSVISTSGRHLSIQAALNIIIGERFYERYLDYLIIMDK